MRYRPGIDDVVLDGPDDIFEDGGRQVERRARIGGQQGDTAISEGKIEGDDLSFTVVRNMNGNEIKLLYKGKVAGDEIKFTRTRVGGDQPGQEFTAKRAK